MENYIVKLKSKDSTIQRIAFIGNYLPRQCGIATFTTDLCEAISTQFPKTTCIAVPINDVEGNYAYPNQVRFEISEKDIESYIRAADFLNLNGVGIVNLQFEYGIFGGKAGSHILALLRSLQMPVVTTLHTILKEPDADHRKVLEEVALLSDRLVVMSNRGAEFLHDIYNINVDKIDVIPHGIPDVSFVDPSFNKDMFGVEGKVVLLSFGLLSLNKGIETVIKALPEVIVQYPNIVYIIAGATHPNVIKHEGETYRLFLQWLAREKNVERNVVFLNRFVSLGELEEIIGIADIYITPYLNETQITSGTLAYTVGAGKAVISTPYWYAQEILADERGILFPFNDFKTLAEEIIGLLNNESKRHSMRKRAYMFGRSMIWKEVAKKYMESFERARIEKRYYIGSGLIENTLDKNPSQLPILNLDHLKTMSDFTGILQHARFTTPNYAHGYTTDDNARALLVSVLLDELGNKDGRILSSRYLSFLDYAFNEEEQKFRNFMDYQRNWLEKKGSDDSQGRTLWALGIVLNRGTITAKQSMAAWLFEKALPAILLTTSPRAWSFALLGICQYLQKYEGDRKVSNVRDELSERLCKLYESNNTENWHWFEKNLSYSNAVIPHALLVGGKSMSNKLFIQYGLESLTWISELQRAKEGYFVPIGSNGFYEKGGKQARFDQQPIEAQSMVSACLEAFKITGDKFWTKEARRGFEWFLGRNDLNIAVYDPSTGGCRDGLHPDRLNENQGAESTLAFLQSLLELKIEEQASLSMELLSK